MSDLGISLADLGGKGPMELEALAGAYGMTGQQLSAVVTKQAKTLRNSWKKLQI